MTAIKADNEALFFVLLVSFCMTLVSVKVVQFYPGVIGNLCPQNPNGYCYKPLPTGGFPLPFLYDKGGVSVVGRLGVEDRFDFFHFALDWLIYFTLLGGILCQITRWRD